MYSYAVYYYPSTQFTLQNDKNNDASERKMSTRTLTLAEEKELLKLVAAILKQD